MPELDVSFMTSDPMLSDSFAIIRRTETISDKGRSVVDETMVPDCVGVITWKDNADLIRLPEGQMVPREIFVASQTPIYGAVRGKQPDLILYLGERYLVRQVLPYSRFGGGTYEVMATSETAMDQPIDNSTEA